MADRDITLRLVVDDTGAVRKLQDVDRAVDKLTESAGPGARALDKLQQEMRQTREEAERLGKELKGTTTQTTQAGGGFEKLTAFVMRFVSAAAIGAAIKSTAEWAGRLQDLSEKTGISTTSLQRLEAAANASGSSIDQVADATVRMSRLLAEGDKGAIAAVQRLGLSLSDLRRMNPGEAFEQVALAIGKLEDPGERAAAAFRLFGRAGADLIPVMKELEGGLDGIVTASPSAIRAVDSLTDALGRMWQQTKAGAVEATGSLLNWLDVLRRAGGRYGGPNLGIPTAPAAPAVGGALPVPGLPADLDTILKQLPGSKVVPGPGGRSTHVPLTAGDRELLISMLPTLGFTGLLTPEQASVLLAAPLPGGGMPMLPPALPSGFVSQPGGPGFWSRLPGMLGGGMNILSGLTGLGLLGGGNTLTGMIGGGLAGFGLGGAISGGLSSLVGASVLPALGPIGAVAGMIIPLVKKLFGPSPGAIAGQQADQGIGQLQGQLLATYGSLDNIRQMGDLVGVSLAAAWGDKNVAGLKHFQDLARQFESQMNRLQSALDKYGLTWEDLGAKAKQFFFEAEATELLKDYQLLITAGVEQDKLLEKMAASWNLLYQQALRNGLEVPNALRPILERLVELGLLLDEAGNKVSNLDGLFKAMDPPTIQIPVEFVPNNQPAGPNEAPTEGGFEAAMQGGLATWRGIRSAALGGFMRGTDSVLAALTPGEFVLTREAVKRVGVRQLQALNRGGEVAGSSVVVQVDARDSVFDGISVQRWADRVGDVMMQRLRSTVFVGR